MTPLGLRLLLIDSLFGCGLAAARLSYHRSIHPAGLVAIIAVLALFAFGSAVCLFLAPKPTNWLTRKKLLDDVGELAEKLPGVALLGTAAGFLIALSGSAADVQQRVTGASTALASTFVGIACWLVLSLQLRLVNRG